MVKDVCEDCPYKIECALLNSIPTVMAESSLINREQCIQAQRDNKMFWDMLL